MSDDFNFERSAEQVQAQENSEVIRSVVQLLIAGQISDGDCKSIYQALPNSVTKSDYNENFDLSDELGCQIDLVRGLRKEIFHADGSLKEQYGIDSAQKVLTASRDLMKILQTSHKDLVTYKRIQAIETAFLDVIQEMPQEEQEKYVELLELYLTNSSD